LFALLEAGPVVPCRHQGRVVALPGHQLGAAGRCCNHGLACGDCGAVVGVESWRLDLGASAHRAAFPAAGRH